MMRSKVLTALIFSAVLMTAILGFTISPSSALTQRDFSYGNNSHQTASTGNTKVCGDHICASGEWKRTHDPHDKQSSDKSPVPQDKKGFIIPKKIKKVTTL